VECTRKTVRGEYRHVQSRPAYSDKQLTPIPGDKVEVHYRGTLDADGSEFGKHNPYDLHEPLRTTKD